MDRCMRTGNTSRNFFWSYDHRVEGFSLDYLYLNLIGYTFYGIYSTIGYFTSIKGAGTTKSNFHRYHPIITTIGTVLLGDLIFVYHAIPIVIVEAVQCCYYPVRYFFTYI